MQDVTPPRRRTLPDLVDEMALRDPARECIVGGSERLSYAETRTRIRQLAKGLHRAGVARGDHVALLMPNRREWLLIDFAVTSLGASWFRSARGHALSSSRTCSITRTPRP